MAEGTKALQALFAFETKPVAELKAIVIHLVQILLPVPEDPTGAEVMKQFADVRTELAARFGGVTLHRSAPAEGLWVDDGKVDRDRIVVVEVMTNDLDRLWWAGYRRELEDRFNQQEVVVRAQRVERL